MRRAILFALGIVMLSCPRSSFSAPLLEGQSQYGSSFLVSWQVFESDAVDNPRPQDDQFTYLYWIEHTGNGTPLYSFLLQGEELELGEITITDFIPGTGIEPYYVDIGSWSGFNDDFLGPGERTATLFVNSPNVPGQISATPYWCHFCDQGPNYAIGPVATAPGPGDYNLDGYVDDRDLETWKVAYGTEYWPADGNGDGQVGAADFTVWRDNLGSDNGAGFGSSAVPEPSAILMLAILGFAAALKPRGRR